VTVSVETLVYIVGWRGAGRPVANPALIGLAAIKALWDERQKDYIDTFVPLVAECIRTQADDEVALQPLHLSIKEQFGLRLPQHVLEAILRKAMKSGYVGIRHKAYFRDRTALADLGFERVRAEALRQHNSVVEELWRYEEGRYALEWTLDEAEKALVEYLRQSDLLIGVRPDAISVVEGAGSGLPGARFIVGSFIQQLQPGSVISDYLAGLVKGFMLASALFLSDVTDAGRLFRHTSVYLDTPLILRALGYAGRPRQEPCLELLQLLDETGATLKCFTHTLEEVRGVLEFCAMFLRRKGLLDGDLGLSASLEYFLTSGRTSSDVELCLARLETVLTELGIAVVDTPEYEHRFTIDEAELDGLLNAEIAYRNPVARGRDVSSISAIMRLRKGMTTHNVETCRAVLATTNASLARVTRHEFRKGIGPVIEAQALTILLWLKKPSSVPDLPYRRVVADCYAATQPDDGLWRAYVEEIRKAADSGCMTADQYYLLRTSIHARNQLMEVTLGEQEALSDETINEIRDRVEREIRRDAEDRLAAAEAELAVSRDKELSHQARLRRQAHLVAVRVVKAAKWLGFGILLAAGVIAAVQRDWTFSVACGILLAAVTAASAIWTQGLQSASDMVVTRLTKTVYERYLNRLFGLPSR
jgi:hypothetical protein